MLGQLPPQGRKIEDLMGCPGMAVGKFAGVLVLPPHDPLFTDQV